MLTSAELDRLSVVLVGSRNPLNIGAAARAMSNFGFLHLRVVRPYDVAFREAKSAVGAEPVLTAAQEFDQVSAAVADSDFVVGTTGDTQRNTEEPLCRLEAAADLVRERLHSGSRVALLFGSEKVGLSNRDLSHCQLLLRIPTRTGHPSMNLGQAVAIVLYEMVRHGLAEGSSEASAETSAPTSAAIPVERPAEAPVVPQQPFASAGERERMIAVLLAALERSGFGHRGPGPSLEEKLRRLVRHLNLSEPDLQEWLGLLRQILWKLEKETG